MSEETEWRISRLEDKLRKLEDQVTAIKMVTMLDWWEDVDPANLPKPHSFKNLNRREQK